MKNNVVYKISLPDFGLIKNNIYIGITSNFEKRKKSHISRIKKLLNNIKIAQEEILNLQKLENKNDLESLYEFCNKISLFMYSGTHNSTKKMIDFNYNIFTCFVGKYKGYYGRYNQDANGEYKIALTLFLNDLTINNLEWEIIEENIEEFDAKALSSHEIKYFKQLNYTNWWNTSGMWNPISASKNYILTEKIKDKLNLSGNEEKIINYYYLSMKKMLDLLQKENTKVIRNLKDLNSEKYCKYYDLFSRLEYQGFKYNDFFKSI